MANINQTTRDARVCVGRDVELASLDAQLAAASRNIGSVCLVTGGVGAGKSTLLREFAHVAGDDRKLVVAWGHCDAQSGSLRPLLPWTGILESLAGVSEAVAPAARPKHRDRRLGAARKAFNELAPDIVELLLPGAGLVIRSAQFIGKRTSLGKRLARGRYAQDATPASADRAQFEDQYVKLIERVLDDSPSLLLIDDLHCADTASLDLLVRLAGRTTQRPLLIVAATQDRPDDVKLRTALDAVWSHLKANVIDLDAAMRERGRALVAAYVQEVVPGVGGEFVERLAAHTGGHPLFVVELIDHLIQAGQLRRAADGTWRDDAAIDWQHLPKQVRSVLTAQFNALSDELREVLETASVEGDQFTVEIVASVLERSPMSVARMLSRRAPRNLVEPLGTFPIGTHRTTRFRFCHSLAQQHAYASIAEIERPYLHEAVAEAYEALIDADAGPFAAKLAFHFDRAALPARANAWYARAARYAESTGALTEAVVHLERALALCETTPPAAVLSELGRVYAMIGRVAEAADLFERAIEQADRLDTAVLAEILIDQTHTLARLHRLDAAFDAASRALALDAGATVNAAASDALSNVCSKRGEHRRALEYQDAALAFSAELDDDDLVAQILFRRGWCLKELGRYGESLSALQQALALQDIDRPNWSRLAATHNALADLEISLEHYSHARGHLRLAIDAWRKFDQHADMAVALNTLANLANREGLFQEALTYGEEAHALDLQLLGAEHPDVAFALTCIGESCIGLERYDAAIDALTRADALRGGHDVPAGNRAWTRWLLGRALAESQLDAERGVALVQQARAVFESMGTAAASELKDVVTWLAAR